MMGVPTVIAAEEGCPFCQKSFMLGGRGTDQLYGKFDRALAAHDAELTERVRAEQREADAQIVAMCALRGIYDPWDSTEVERAIREANRHA